MSKRAALVLALMAAPALLAAGTAATLAVDASTVLTTFNPRRVFGVNTMYWVGTSDTLAAQPKTAALGTRNIRYPGGSSSDDYHWNGKGSYTGDNVWVPDNAGFAPGFDGSELHRGTTSNYGVAAKLTDGDAGTFWRSHADTDFPNAQWVYLKLASSQTASRMEIAWADPAAATFRVQYWASASSWPPPFQSQTSHWADTSAGVLAGAGAGVTQTVAFTAAASQYWRVLCTSSAASPAQYAIAELRLYNGASQLTVNTAALDANGQPTQTWTVASSTDAASVKRLQPTLGFEDFMAYCNSFDPPVEPLITVNFGTGTPQEAAAWVHYANVVRGYGIKRWEVGNETHGDWETGGPINAKDYARRYIEFYEAMKAEDPGIEVIGPVAGGPVAESNNQDNKTFIQGFIDRLAADPGGDKAAYAEGISFHWYPLYQDNSEADLLATPSQMATVAANWPTYLANHPSAGTLPVYMNETNGGIDVVHGYRLAGGLWLANWLGELIRGFGPRAGANVWDLQSGGSADTSATAADFGMLQGQAGAWQFQERATYWAMQMMATRWCVPFSSAAHQLVQTASSQATLAAYAARRPDGLLALLVVNKSPSTTYDAAVSVAGFTPNAGADRWTFDGSNYQWVTGTGTPYHASPDLPPTQGVEAASGAAFSHSFPPYSITVFQFTAAGQPLPSATATSTPRPSPTATPTWGPVAMIDDFEETWRNGTPPNRMNLWGGSWGANSSGGPFSVGFVSAPGAAGTAYAVAWNLTVTAGGWANLLTDLPAAFDAAAAGFVGLQFWAWGDGGTWRVTVKTGVVTDYDNYGTDITPPAGRWTFYQLRLFAMRRQGWGTQSPAPPTVPLMNDVTGLQIAEQGTGVKALRLDQIAFYKAEAQTPSPTISPTFTRSPSPSPSATAEPSGTATESPSFTQSSTQSLTHTPSPTVSASPTSSATASATLTATITATPSASPTPSATAVPSGTVSPTPLATAEPKGAPEIDVVRLCPNPVTARGRASLALRITRGRADGFRVRVYSPGNVKTADLHLGPAGPGWVSLPLPDDALPANGVWHVELWAEYQGAVMAKRILPLFVAR